MSSSSVGGCGCLDGDLLAVRGGLRRRPARRRRPRDRRGRPRRRGRPSSRSASDSASMSASVGRRRRRCRRHRRRVRRRLLGAACGCGAPCLRGASERCLRGAVWRAVPSVALAAATGGGLGCRSFGGSLGGGALHRLHRLPGLPSSLPRTPFRSCWLSAGVGVRHRKRRLYGMSALDLVLDLRRYSLAAASTIVTTARGLLPRRAANIAHFAWQRAISVARSALSGCRRRGRPSRRRRCPRCSAARRPPPGSGSSAAGPICRPCG